MWKNKIDERRVTIDFLRMLPEEEFKKINKIVTVWRRADREVDRIESGQDEDEDQPVADNLDELNGLLDELVKDEKDGNRKNISIK